nr:hypothetical protein [Tanacetum cinerariifolium]
MKEEMMYERMDLEREREEQEWQAIMDPLNEFRFSEQEESMDVEMYNRTKASINFMVNTQESVTHGQPLIFEPAIMENASVQPTQSLPAFTEGPSVQPAQAVNIQPANDNASKKRGKRTKSELEVPFRIYHKNIGRSERIRNMQEKKFKFDAQGTRSTAEKTFDETLKKRWRYLIPAESQIHNHMLIPDYQDIKYQDFRYSDEFECYQVIKIGRYEHVSPMSLKHKVDEFTR